MSKSQYRSQGGWIQGLVQGANNTVVNIFETGFQALSNVLEPVVKSLVPESVKSRPESAEIHSQYLIKKERLEIEKRRLENEIISDERLIHLKEKELELKDWFFAEKLKIIKTCHIESVQLKWQELQSNWDNLRLPWLLNREETQKQLFRSDVNFWILLSPPKIICNVQEFDSLGIQIEKKLRSLINQHYLIGHLIYPVGCRKIFSEPIEDQQAIHAREILSPLPTLTLQSAITNEDIYITLTCPVDETSSSQHPHDNQIDLPEWNWKSIKKSLETAGTSNEESISFIKELIIAFHVIVSFYFIDLYCIQIYPYHDIRLFHFLDTCASPGVLNQWAKPFKSSLLKIQKNEIERAKRVAKEESGKSEIDSARSATEDVSPAGVAILVAVGLAALLGFCTQPLFRQYAVNEESSIRSPGHISSSDPSGGTGQPSQPGGIKNGQIVIITPIGGDCQPLRESPDQYSSKIGCINAGKELIAVSDELQSGWVRVHGSANGVGWVFWEGLSIRRHIE